MAGENKPIKVIPTLSSEGYVINTEARIDRALAYMLVCEASQSTMFRGKVTSLQAIVQRHNNEPELLKTNAEEALGNYFRRLFETVQLEVLVEDYPETQNTKVALRIYVTVIENGITYSVANIANFTNGVFQDVTAINEGRQVPTN